MNAVLNGSPELTTISLRFHHSEGADHSDMIKAMLQAAGRKESVTVVPPPASFL